MGLPKWGALGWMPWGLRGFEGSALIAKSLFSIKWIVLEAIVKTSI